MDTQDSSKSLHYKLLSQHGREVIVIFRKAERTGNKLANWRNHRMFNLRCLHKDVIPVSVKLVSNVRGTEARKILCKAEKRLLEVRIRHCNFTIAKLKAAYDSLTSDLYSRVDQEEATEVETFLTHAHNHRFTSVKCKQITPFLNEILIVRLMLFLIFVVLLHKICI